MAKTLVKNTYPDNHVAEDFSCFGPPAIKDGEFENVKIADLGCFNQDGQDSNKGYHAAVVQSKKTSKWYCYFEWGRVGTKPTFQFIECNSEQEAQKEFAKQLHSKNDKRGEWVDIAGIRTLRAKKGKDCYLVRPLATRSTGLPDAKTIKLNESSSSSSSSSSNSKIKKSNPKVDKYTLQLLKDLNVGTVAYTKGSMADSSLPTQKAIDEARDILIAAQKRLVKVGNEIKDQLADSEIVSLTNLMYSRIPKKKALKVDPSIWLLTKDNILNWQNDLDVFESALTANIDDIDSDPYNGMPFSLEWIDPKTSLGTFLHRWIPSASANKHAYLGSMKIKNIWKVDRKGDEQRLLNTQKKISEELKNKNVKEKPLFQPSDRVDIATDPNKDFYYKSNTGLLFHGSKSVNISGILKEGLRFPKELVGVTITGNMFGGGTYWADDFRKSAGYTSLRSGYYTYGSGGISGRDAFMFIGDVVVGNAYVASGPYGYTKVPDKYHCIFGKAGKSGVQNNEWVIFSKEQINLRYLLEFTA